MQHDPSLLLLNLRYSKRNILLEETSLEFQVHAAFEHSKINSHSAYLTVNYRYSSLKNRNREGEPEAFRMKPVDKIINFRF